MDQVVYNWNTKGAGYALEAAPNALIALNRTGALPVSYIPTGGGGPEAIEKAEDAAYEFFASIGDPNLARVVQYAAIYQIFTNLRIKATGGVPGNANQHAAPFLETEANKLLIMLKDAGEQQLVIFALQMAMKEITASGIREEIDSDRASFEKKVGHPLKKSDYRKILELVQQGYAAEKLKFLEKAQVQLREKDGAAFEAFVSAVVNNGMRPEFEDYASFFRAEADLEALRDRVVESNPPTQGTWIHTPAVVVSSNAAPMTSCVGGHNLDAEVSLSARAKTCALAR